MELRIVQLYGATTVIGILTFGDYYDYTAVNWIMFGLFYIVTGLNRR